MSLVRESLAWAYGTYVEGTRVCVSADVVAVDCCAHGWVCDMVAWYVAVVLVVAVLRKLVIEHTEKP
jgi:hypothetical protein